MCWVSQLFFSTLSIVLILYWYFRTKFPLLLLLLILLSSYHHHHNYPQLITIFSFQVLILQPVVKLSACYLHHEFFPSLSGFPTHCCVHHPWQSVTINVQHLHTFTVYYQHPSVCPQIKATTRQTMNVWRSTDGSACNHSYNGKYWILRVCVCSLRYLTCNPRESYCHL